MFQFGITSSATLPPSGRQRQQQRQELTRLLAPNPSGWARRTRQRERGAPGQPRARRAGRFFPFLNQDWWTGSPLATPRLVPVGGRWELSVSYNRRTPPVILCRRL
jgi:hypothetical protein